MYSTAAASDDTEAPPQPQSEAASEANPSDEEGGGEEEEETATQPTHGTTTTTTMMVQASPNLDALFGLREIGREALCWQLSSAKPGNGVEQIRDQSVDTYWQSDGTSQPHWIQVHFARRVAISHICLYLDYNLDESYTPKKLQVQAGMTNQDLSAALYPPNTQIELHEPVGWCVIPLSSPPDPLDDCEDDQDDDSDPSDNNDPQRQQQQNQQLHWNSRKVVRAHLFRISVLSMHQNGRDTHIRQVQLYGPRMGAAGTLVAHRPKADAMEVTTEKTTDTEDDDAWVKDLAAMTQFTTIR